MSETEANFGTALYYPYIRVQNENWLKCSLLYWDRIRRIVPNELDDDNFNKEYSKQGLLVNTDAIDYRDDASVLFKERFLPVIEGELRPQFKKSSEFLSKLNMTVYNTKFCDTLKDDLEEKGLIERSGPWYRTVPIVGGYFMISLASVMSEKIHAPLITDTYAFEKASRYCLYGETKTAENVDNQSNDLIVHLELPFPTSEMMTNISLDTILKFRDKYKDERMQFRKAIEQLKYTFAQLEDNNEKLDFLSQKKQEIEIAVADHKKALESYHILSINSMFQISAPAFVGIATSFMSFLDSVSKIVAFTSGVIISGVSWWTKVRQEKRKCVKECPWHYLLPLSRKFDK